MELLESDDEVTVEENLNNLLRVNSADQGYYVALFLQRIISRFASQRYSTTPRAV